MNTSCSVAVLAALAFLAQIAAARGQKITDVSPNLPSVKACAVETITVKGTGKCAFGVNWGDSTRTTVLLPRGMPGGGFPVNVTHIYSQQGNYTVNVAGVRCGSATTNVIVVGPIITSAYPFSQVTPGGWVLLQGENFGNLPGQMRIHLTSYPNQPIDVPLQNLQWGDTFAA